MPAYSFKKRFIEPIIDGTKQQTIRNPRVRPTKKGDNLYLYYGMRTKHCMKIGTATCEAVKNVTITVGGRVIVDHIVLPESFKNDFARLDGFADWQDMLCFFYAELPLRAELIMWKNFKPAK